MRTGRFLLSLIAFVVIYMVFVLWIDRPIALWAHQHLLYTQLYDVCIKIQNWLSTAHWGILAILTLCIATSLALTGKTRNAKRWALFSFSIIVALIICLVCKVVLGRYRPVMLFEHHQYGFHFFATKHNLVSSPSGHATAAFAGLYALAMVIKRNWITVLLMIVATVIALSRIVVTAHYPSDVIFGAYIGILTPVYLVHFFPKLLGVHSHV